MAELAGHGPETPEFAPTATDATAEEKPQSLRKSVTGACVGALMEYYDFSIYATLTIYLSRHFFPPEDPSMAVLLAVSSMGVAFVVRPLGGLVFGSLADRIGRRKIFLATLFLMSFATIGVGILPGYAALGIAAPIILVLLRVGQGLAVGGEYAAASTYVVEHSPRERRGYYTGWLAAMASSAIVLALFAVSLTQATMSQESFEAWGWRVPFLFAIVLLAGSLFIRRQLRESPVFQAMEEKGTKAASPLRQVISDWKAMREILVVAVGVCAPQITSGVTGSILALYFLQTMTTADPAHSNLLVAIGTITAIPTTVWAGHLSDIYGRRQILIAGMVLGILFYLPLFHLLMGAVGNTPAMLAIIVALQIPSSLIVGTAFSTIPEIFPASRRTTSVAIVFSLAGIVGGLAPAVSLALAERGGVLAGVAWPVAILLVGLIVNLMWVPNRTGAAID